MLGTLRQLLADMGTDLAIEIGLAALTLAVAAVRALRGRPKSLSKQVDQLARRAARAPP